MSSTTHVITGGTGLVGSGLILTLAAKTDDQFACLARSGSGAPEERLERALHRTAEAFALDPAVVKDAMRRTRIIPADVTDDPGGVPDIHPSGRVEVWHSAGLMLFSRKERDRVFRTNVHGTRNMLTLAKKLGAEQFNFMSTAMVAPSDKVGTILEEPVDFPAPRNPYEESKVEAERIALAEDGFPVRVMRPSIIVGHSETLHLPSEPNGAYLVQKALAIFQRKAAGEGLAAGRRMLALPDEGINMVPVDHVVQDAVDVSLYGARHGVFNLTNSTPPTIRDALLAMTGNCGMGQLTFTQDPDSLDESDLLLQRFIGAYNPYLNSSQVFDRRRTDAACRWREDGSWNPGMERLRKMFLPCASASPS